MGRIAIAAVVAGLVVFLWSAVSHLVLPLGTMGVRSLPDEDRLVAEMERSIPAPGLYLFPAMDSTHTATEAGREAQEDRRYRGPTGLLVFTPQGDGGMSPRRLLLEVVSTVLAAWVAALLVARVAGGVAARSLFVALMGVFGWLSILLSYWNWYGFPTAFVLAAGVDEFAGWFLGGWVLASVVPPPRPAAPRA